MSDKLTCETPRYFGDTKLTLQRRRRPHHRRHRRPGAADPAAPALARDHRPVGDAARVRPRAGRHRPLQARLVGARARAIVLERRDDYWGEAPAVEKATYVFRTDPAVAAAMVDAGRGRPRAVDLGGRRDQPGDRRLLPQLRDPLPAHRQRHRPDQRQAGARGAEHGDRPRRLHRHAAARGHVSAPSPWCRRRRSAGTRT